MPNNDRNEENTDFEYEYIYDMVDETDEFIESENFDDTSEDDLSRDHLFTFLALYEGIS